VEYSAVGKGGGVVHDAAPGCSSTATRIPATPRRQGYTTHDMQQRQQRQQLQQPAGRWNRGGRNGVLTASDTSVCVGEERGLEV
jgi:hypothetical protein